MASEEPIRAKGIYVVGPQMIEVRYACANSIL